jgi:uncharacterized membrane protein
MIGLFVSAGIYHFINPNFYLKVMPPFINNQLFWVYVSGLTEITLGLLLFFDLSRFYSAIIIIIMLWVFLFLIHIPMSIHFYKTENKWFLFSVIRIAIQFALMYWSWFII